MLAYYTNKYFWLLHVTPLHAQQTDGQYPCLKWNRLLLCVMTDIRQIKIKTNTHWFENAIKTTPALVFLIKSVDFYACKMPFLF